MIKNLKFAAFFVAGFLIAFLILKVYEEKEQPVRFTKRIGYIPVPKKLDLDSIRMDMYNGLYGYFSSAAPKIYNGSKYQFRKNITESFNSSKYSDNGYLTLRFYINSQSKVFLNETIEMDLDLNTTELNDSMVQELEELSFREENWKPYGHENHNYYMHLTYRIENGKITEIIP